MTQRAKRGRESETEDLLERLVSAEAALVGLQTQVTVQKNETGAYLDSLDASLNSLQTKLKAQEDKFDAYKEANRVDKVLKNDSYNSKLGIYSYN